MITKEQLRAMCFDEAGTVRPKAEVRAEMINKCILDEMMDIDESEDLIDKSLREFNLWGEPTLEDLLKDDEPDDVIANP
ncbi:hypothetical protein IPH19_03565 [Candidatus Uhrbacteria bacterium]|nr:MAG: hypothetical protein IPH19_03565 [Candidatus Uhrbacteria bacterium]